jgi:hypothetical protein
MCEAMGWIQLPGDIAHYTEEHLCYLEGGGFLSCLRKMPQIMLATPKILTCLKKL